jgi:hypothetical protein
MVNEARRLIELGETGVRTNQALHNGQEVISRLRPDVQYIKDGLIHIIEVNVFGGTDYQVRERLLKSVLGALFGSYKGR